MAIIKKGDVVIITLVCILAIVWFAASYGNPGELTAKVFLDGELNSEFKLSEIDEEQKIEVGECVIEVKQGSISFVASSCKDKLCIKHGEMFRNNETMACVPCKVVIVLSSDKSEFDAMAY